MSDPKPRVRSTVSVAASVVRVSAPLRRGAAPYADGSLRSQAPSYLISLLNLSGSGAGTRGDLREILCTTQWRKNFPLLPSPVDVIDNPPNQRVWGPHMMSVTRLK